MDKASRALRVAGGLAVSLAGGALFAWIGTPLPWMIGSMLAMALAQLAGARFVAPAALRDAGFVVVGLTLGLHFSAPVVKEVAAHWPWFVALGFAAHALGTLSALVLARLSGADRATAYFGSMPAGAAEMVQLSAGFGASADKVAFAHSLRMLLVVTLFPIGITLAGLTSEDYELAVRQPFSLPGLAMLLALGAAAGWLGRRVRLPAAFIMAPLFLAALLTMGGLQLSSMPGVLVNAAQVALGALMGSRFDRRFLRSAPRFVAALVPAMGVTLGLAVAAGAAISLGSGVSPGNGLLAAAPGGIAEMSITAQVLHLGVAFVTAAHVIRFVIVVLLTVPVFHMIERWRPARRR